jgi:cytoskeletal protein CcmA (bactofilin family)
VTDATWTLLGPGSVVRGELLLAGEIVLHGRIEGTLYVDGEVLVAAGASVEGGIHARRIVIEGTCRGRIEGTREVVIKRGAVVSAEIHAGILLVEEGARVQEHQGSSEPPRVLPWKRESPGNA